MNTGLRGGLFEAVHFKRMGAAVWLYGWLVLRQTRQQGGVGWVLGGHPLRLEVIQQETGYARRTIQRWMRTLERRQYIECDLVPQGIVVRILRAKKFGQAGLPFPGGAGGWTWRGATPGCANDGAGECAKVGAPGAPELAREGAQAVSDEPDASRIEKESRNFRRENLSKASGERNGWQETRRLREEAVRREASVGQGPEVVRAIAGPGGAPEETPKLNGP